MGRLSGWIRYYLPLFLVAAFLLPLVGAYRALVSRREQILNRHAFQTLGAVSTNLQHEVRALADNFRSAAQGEMKTSAEAAFNTRSFLKNYLEGFDVEEQKSKPGALEEPFLRIESSPSSDRGPLLVANQRALTIGSQTFWQARVPASALLNRILPRSRTKAFEQVLLADSTGQVWARISATETLAFSNLAELAQTDAPTIPEPETIYGWTVKTTPILVNTSPEVVPVVKAFNPASTSRRRAQIAGEEYILFLQPTNVPFRVGAEGRNFVVVGLAPASWLRGISSEFPNFQSTSVLLTVLAILGILWPLLRLKTMSSLEPLTLFSGRIMVLGAVASLALLCLLFLSWGFGITLRQRTYFRLEALADRLERNVSSEIRDAICAIRTVGDRLRDSDKNQTSLDRLGGKEIQTTAPLCVESRAFRTETRTGLRMSQERFYFDQIVLAGAERGEHSETGEPDLEQQKKVSLRAIPTPLRKLYREDFGFMASLRDGDGAYHIHQPTTPTDNNGNAPPNLPFAMEPLYSPATGEFLTVIGMRERLMTFPNPPASPGLALINGIHHRTIATRMLSLTEASLPIGFQFAVIEPDGRVLFHSESHRNLRDNFFSDLESPARFRAIAAHRTPSHLVDTYAGQEYFFHVRPLFPQQRHNGQMRDFDHRRPPVHGINWILIVFRDAGYVRSLQMEAGMLTFSLMSMLLLSFGLCYLAWHLYRAVWHGKGFANMSKLWRIREHWPKESRRTHYAVTTILSLIAVVVIFALVALGPIRNLKGGTFGYWMGSLYLFAAVCFAAIVALLGEILKGCGAGYLWIAMKRKAVERIGRKSVLVTFSLHLACLAFAVIGSAMLILYRISLDATLAEHRTLSRQEAVTAFHERFERFYEESLRLGLDDLARRTWVSDRVAFPIDLYDPFTGGSTEKLIREVQDQPHVRLAVALGRPLLERMWGGGSTHELHTSMNDDRVERDFPARNEAQEPLKGLTQLPTQSLEDRAIGGWPVLPSPFQGRGPSEAAQLATLGGDDAGTALARIRAALLPEPESIIFYSSQVLVAFLLGFWIVGVIEELYALGLEERKAPTPTTTLELTDLGDDRRRFYLNQPMTGASKYLKQRFKTMQDPRTQDGMILFDCAQEMNKKLESIEWDLRRTLERVKEAHLLVVDNIEFRISEPMVDAQKLKLIESAAVRQECAIICLSSVDPVEHLSSLRRETKVPELAAELDQQIARWVRMLGAFKWFAFESEAELLEWRRNALLRKTVENFAVEDGDSPWPRYCGLLETALKDNATSRDVDNIARQYEVDRGVWVVRVLRVVSLGTVFLMVPLFVALQFLDLAIWGYLDKSTPTVPPVVWWAAFTIGGGIVVRTWAKPQWRSWMLKATFGVTTLLYAFLALFPEKGSEYSLRWGLMGACLSSVGMLLSATSERLNRYFTDLVERAKQIRMDVISGAASGPIPARNEFLDCLMKTKTLDERRQLGETFRFAHYELMPVDAKARDLHSLHAIFAKIFDEMNASVCMRQANTYKPIVEAALERTYRSVKAVGGSEVDPSDFFRHLSAQVRDAMEGYYRMVWNTTTKEERLVLYQLSRDGWINPKNRRAIGHLMRRRIIFEGETGYRTLSSSFARFVVEVQPRHEIEEWVAEEKASVWQSLRVGLYSLVVAIFVFLWYVEPELFHSYLTGLFALSAGLFSLFRVYTEISRRIRAKSGAGPRIGDSSQP